MSRRRLASGVVAALAVAVWVSWATAQPAGRAYRVGILWSADAADSTRLLEPFRRALEAEGFAPGRGLTFEHRYAGGRLEQCPALAAELAAARVDVIVAASPLAIRAAQQATTAIPIVMVNGDPAMFASVARPGNVTGLTALQEELAAKQVELLREAVPGLARVAVLRNPTQPVHAVKLNAAEAAARALRLHVHVAEARAPEDFEGAFAGMERERAGGLVVFADGTFLTHRARLAELALRHALPTCFGSPGAAESGGLIAYVPSIDEAFGRAAQFVARILRGARPADLPVERPTRFELTVNVRTARALRLALPPSLLARANHVIE